MSQKKFVIGITGEICAGKDSLANLVSASLKIEGKQVLVVRTSDILREIFEIINISPKRIDFHAMTEFLRHQYGEDILAQIVRRRLSIEGFDVILWVGLRSSHDIDALAEFNNSMLVFVDATPEERFGRILKRNENNDDKGKTWKQFLQDCQRSTERTIRSFRSTATIVIENSDNQLDSAHERVLEKIKIRWSL